MELKADDAISRTLAYAAGKPNLTVGEVLGGAFIVTQSVKVLTNTLPYSITSTEPVTDTPSVPDAYRHFVNLQFYSSTPTTRTISYTATQASLANKRLVVAFEAATPGDQRTIDQYGGSLINTPPSSIKIVPVLRVNGVEVARGISVTGGTAQTWRVNFVDGRGITATASNRIRAGEMLAYGFAYGRSSPDAVAASQKRLAATREAIPKDATGNTLSNTKEHMSEPVMGETLHLMLQSYYNQVDAQTELIARDLNIRWFRGRAVGVAIQTLALNCFLTACFSVSGGGLTYDIARNAYSGVSLSKRAQDEAAFFLLTGHVGSSLEHALFEQVGPRGLSTMRLLGMALAGGMAVYRATQANWAQISPKLKINASIKQNIQQAVNAGNIVTVHEDELTLGDWEGVGWIITNPVTGGFGYLISGGYGDVSSTTQGGALWDVLKKILAFAWLGGNIAFDIWGLIAAVGLFFAAPITLPLLLIGGGLILLNLFALYSDLSDLVTLINGDKSVDQYIGEQLAGLAIAALLKKFGGAALVKVINNLSPDGLAKLTRYFDNLTGGATSRLGNLPCVSSAQQSQTGEAPDNTPCGVPIEKLADLQPETIRALEALVKDARYTDVKDLARRLVDLPYLQNNPAAKAALIEMLSQAPQVPGQPQALRAAVDAALKQNNPGRFDEILRAAERTQAGEVFKKYGDSVTFTDGAGKPAVLTADYVTEVGGKTIWTEVKSNARDSGLLDQLRRAEALYQAIQSGTTNVKVDQYRIEAVGTLPQNVIDFINNSPAKSFFSYLDGLTSPFK